jgi:gluconokinase
MAGMATPSPSAEPPLHLVVMGVAGCGKSLVGARLSAALGLPLVEGDDFHPAGNIEKMRQAIPLTDADRSEWLQRLAQELRHHPQGAVLTCSALKRAYRDTLRGPVPHLRFLHLALTQHQALERVASRTDHFYPPSLVASQFETLEDPAGEPGVHVVDATWHIDRVVEGALRALRPHSFNNA